MTAKPPGSRASTVGFSPRSAEPTRSLRQSVTAATYFQDDQPAARPCPDQPVVPLVTAPNTSQQMVGDRAQDVAGARALGLPSIGVTWGYAEPGELEAAGADQVVGTPQELVNALVDRHDRLCDPE